MPRQTAFYLNHGNTLDYPAPLETNPFTAARLKVIISTPETQRPTGNFGTAFQWAGILERELGHEVEVMEGADPSADLLIALHAKKSAGAIRKYREARPGGRIFVGLAGTDIYPEPTPISLESMEIADRLIVLQDRAILKVPEHLRSKAVTIIQSASTDSFCPPGERSTDPFQVCVIGFLRDIKDPMRAAFAARELPAESKIQVLHAGGILEEKYENLVAKEESENPRYQWKGILDRSEIDVLLSQCQLMVLSSFHEGGARVLSYAVVNHTPVLAAASDCAISLLGENYPGLYSPGNTVELADLFHRAETDVEFLEELRKMTRELAPQFSPEKEIAAWKNLL